MNDTAQSKPGHITIALAVFNGEDTIEKAVRSVIEQSYENFDLYVVDDASKDTTFEILQSLLPEDRRLHVIRLEKNEGTYSAKNLVLKEFCKGEFFAHQDADDFSWENRIKAQVEFLGKYPEIAVCGTGIDEFYLSEKESPSTQSDYAPFFNKDDGYFYRENRYPPRISKGASFDLITDKPTHIKIAMNGSLVFRSSVLKQLGGFDGRTRLAGDVELLRRILLFHSIGNLQEILYSRLFHSRSLTKSKIYGFGSDLRNAYVKKARARIRKLKPFYDVGDTQQLVRAATEDMFVGASPYEVYPENSPQG